MPDKYNTYKIIIKGVVQGVGFRPFIWKIASDSGINGTVYNTTEGVVIMINLTSSKEVEDLIIKIKNQKPSPATIESIQYLKIDFSDYKDFNISSSIPSGKNFQLISPDLATCKECIDDINNSSDIRRFSYAFTNCTNCGPRFTIIKKMPYDRSSTVMDRFKMCPDCLAEYNDPRNRRFHAQPNACRHCGPRLQLADNGLKIIDDKEPVLSAAEALKNGKIVALKSLGGFQIACDATNPSAVMLLRKRKKRPKKPFAMMFKDIDMVKRFLRVSKFEESLLMSPSAPIVLLQKNYLNDQTVPGVIDSESISSNVSFYNKYDGAFLPYTPLHHILFRYIGFPLVMTSGNISEEPIASINKEASQRLRGICDLFLIHNRDIYSKYDDSVVRAFNGKEMVLRRARGYAPYPVKLDLDIGDKTILATGAQEKNTFCIFTKNYAILSQHIGDLDTVEATDFYKTTLNTYMDLFSISKFDAVAHDNHPDYESTKIALKDFPDAIKMGFQHHAAHIAGVIAENRIFKNNYTKKILGFAWDGTGFGEDGNIWGSEIFLVDKKLNFQHVGNLSKKILPGGEISIKKPYRMAMVYLYGVWERYYSKKNKDFYEFIYKEFPFYGDIIKRDELSIVLKQIRSGFNSPVTTSMGRFFDAVSSLLDLTHEISYEGEAAVHLEMTADEKSSGKYDLKFIEEKGQDKIIFDDIHIFNQVVNDLWKKTDRSIIAARFHNTLLEMILSTAKKIQINTQIEIIALAGGVFQNNILLENCFKVLKKAGFEVFTKLKVPVNDGGISLGQAYLAAKNQV